ncbi:uncharacterized protein LOC143440933 isoform X4 [Arvicanthis niloticus]|uniref:uncharacterized protein LOC143440933 isoform X4 n=1 Tax=Arvicanthis niloticus TaxID=61156 RepID=UPI00403D335E
MSPTSGSLPSDQWTSAVIRGRNSLTHKPELLTFDAEQRGLEGGGEGHRSRYTRVPVFVPKTESQRRVTERNGCFTRGVGMAGPCSEDFVFGCDVGKLQQSSLCRESPSKWKI